ncbi:DMT family transporter [Alphaproteobacteria bacterium LSUCC0226]|jgi:drug/metabolite transporter (DMT)-like permease
MKLTDNVFGAILMAVSMLSFISNDALMKFLFQTISVEQGIFMRGLVSVPLLALIAYLRKSLFVRIDWRNWRVILTRAFAELAATMAFLTALSNMPLANITAILQALPLTVTMFAAIFFGEQVGWRRWGAILAGFIGVLIIIRPSDDGFNEYAVLAIVAVACVTVRDAITRRLDRSVPSLFVAFISAIPIFIYGGVATATTGWTVVSGTMIGIVVVAAIAITCGYLFAVMAMRNGEISFVAPFRYTGMIWAILFGFLLFGDLPDAATILGTMIVIGMGVYAFHRERIRQRASASSA